MRTIDADAWVQELERHIQDEECPGELKDYCMHLIGEIGTRPTVGQDWIPCSDKLPEKYGEYLCCDKYGEYIIGYPTARVSSDDYYVETEHEIMNNCIAWQPLPEPYEPGQQSKEGEAE